MTELVLGTAQFGLNYGLTNIRGKIPSQEFESLVQTSNNLGIVKLDTAASYGDSESKIGQFFADDKFKVISKFNSSVNYTKLDFDAQIVRLNKKVLYGLLIHDNTNFVLNKNRKLINFLNELNTEGLVSKIGVSIYSEEELEKTLDILPNLKLIQLPSNILDDELLNSSLLTDLVKSGVEVHVRSIFLQGLLLADPKKLDKYFDPIIHYLKKIKNIANANNMTNLELLLSVVKFHKNVNGIVVGISRNDDLIEIGNAWNKCKEIDVQLEALDSKSKYILDPRNWQKGN